MADLGSNGDDHEDDWHGGGVDQMGKMWMVIFERAMFCRGTSWFLCSC